jgi:hypothetical protein
MTPVSWNCDFLSSHLLCFRPVSHCAQRYLFAFHSSNSSTNLFKNLSKIGDKNSSQDQTFDLYMVKYSSQTLSINQAEQVRIFAHQPSVQKLNYTLENRAVEYVALYKGTLEFVHLLFTNPETLIWTRSIHKLQNEYLSANWKVIATRLNSTTRHGLLAFIGQ